MSVKKRRDEDTPMPTTAAGLLRFYSERTSSLIKLRPEIVIAASIGTIVLVLLANVL